MREATPISFFFCLVFTNSDTDEHRVFLIK